MPRAPAAHQNISLDSLSLKLSRPGFWPVDCDLLPQLSTAQAGVESWKGAKCEGVREGASYHQIVPSSSDTFPVEGDRNEELKLPAHPPQPLQFADAPVNPRHLTYLSEVLPS